MYLVKPISLKGVIHISFTIGLNIFQPFYCLYYLFISSYIKNDIILFLILDGIMAHLRTDMGCIKPGMAICGLTMRGLQTG